MAKINYPPGGVPDVPDLVPPKFTASPGGGVKDDDGKLDPSLLAPEAIESLIRVLEFGKKKYGRDNWKGLDKQRVKDAAWRHWNEMQKGETHDPDTGEPHGAHLMACGMFLTYMDL